MRRTILSAFAILVFARPVPAFADPIVSTLPPRSLDGWFWIGTIDTGGGPDGLNRTLVAQTFQTYRDYSQVTGSVLLLATGGLTTLEGQPLTVSFALASNAGGQPGTVLASTDVTLNVAGFAVYQLPFQSVSLLDGQTYWLIASSTTVHTAAGGGLPTWMSSNKYGGDMAYSQNSGPWTFLNQSFAFSMDGTVTGDSVSNGDPIVNPDLLDPPVQAIPEPTVLLALLGVVPAALAIRRKRKTRAIGA
jgi:hypothetical protein